MVQIKCELSKWIEIRFNIANWIAKRIGSILFSSVRLFVIKRLFHKILKHCLYIPLILICLINHWLTTLNSKWLCFVYDLEIRRERLLYSFKLIILQFTIIELLLYLLFEVTEFHFNTIIDVSMIKIFLREKAFNFPLFWFVPLNLPRLCFSSSFVRWSPYVPNLSIL